MRTMSVLSVALVLCVVMLTAAGCTPTPTPTASVKAEGTPPVELAKTCPQIEGKAPADVIQKAMDDPASVGGWGELLDPGKPYNELSNPYRTSLTLQNQGVPYNPMSNSLVFKAGCP